VGLVGERADQRGAAGGIVGGPEVSTAALLSLLGLPGFRFLTTEDEEERLLLSAVAKRAVELQDQMQRNLAIHVVNTLAKSMRRG
jgi:hypothetical protein